MFIAEVRLAIAVETEAEAYDSVWALLTPQCSTFAANSSLVGWEYIGRAGKPTAASLPDDYLLDDGLSARVMGCNDA